MLRSILILALVSAFATSAGASILRYEAPLGLTASQEVSLPASPATGSAISYYDTTTLLLFVNLQWSDLVAPAVASHIHLGSGPGTNGPIAIPFVGIPNTESGTFTHTYNLDDPTTYTSVFLASSGGTAAGARENLLAQLAAGHGYYNLHSTTFPGGEIRGDIHAVVPEPASMALVGIGGLVLLLRRRFA